MLVLTRKKDEKIMIGDDISIMVIDIRRDKVRLGIEAPRDVPVHRREIYEAIQRKKMQNNSDGDQDKKPSYHIQPLYDSLILDHAYFNLKNSLSSKLSPITEFYI